MGDYKQIKGYKLLTLEVVTVTYESWLLTRGSKHGDFTLKHLSMHFGKQVT